MDASLLRSLVPVQLASKHERTLHARVGSVLVSASENGPWKRLEEISLAASTFVLARAHPKAPPRTGTAAAVCVRGRGASGVTTDHSDNKARQDCSRCGKTARQDRAVEWCRSFGCGRHRCALLFAAREMNMQDITRWEKEHSVSDEGRAWKTSSCVTV